MWRVCFLYSLSIKLLIPRGVEDNVEYILNNNKFYDYLNIESWAESFVALTEIEISVIDNYLL